MKKVLSIILSLILIISCFSVSVFAKNEEDDKQSITSEELTLPKIRYYYLNTSSNDVVMTNNSQEFENNVGYDNQIEVVFELKYQTDDCECKSQLSLSSSDEEVDAIKISHRNTMKEKHSAENNAFLSENGLETNSDDYTVTMSQYAPYIQLVFNDYTNYQNYSSQIVEMSNCENILGVNISLPISMTSDATRVDSVNASNYQMATAINDINASNQTYDGTGINVGIIEAGGVAYTYSHSELSALTIHTVGTSSSPHAINVTRILCGTNGVAPGIDAAYIYYAPYTSSMISAIDWMLENDVDVINASMSTDNLNGQYHWTSALLDYYVRYNYITYVNSAGNDGDSTTDTDTCNYGMGYNVIAVGANDSANNISMYSSFGVDNGIYSRKPTVVAPGTQIVIGGTNIGNGTSYAAPMVAGVVAKLMDEYAFLTLYPEVVMASLIASATPVNGQTTDWDTHAGAGRVNYEKAREAVNNYVTFSYTSDDIGIRTTETISVLRNKKIKVAAVWLINSTTQSSSDHVLVNNQTDYDLLIADESGEFIVGSSGLANIENKKYNNTAYDTLIVQIKQFSARKTDDREWGAFTWVYE